MNFMVHPPCRVGRRPYDVRILRVRLFWRVRVRSGATTRLPPAMPRIAVVTDTTQYLPPDVIARHGIELVSLYVNWDGRTDREADLADYDGFYDHMRSADTLPSTSQASVGGFL